MMSELVCFTFCPTKEPNRRIKQHRHTHTHARINRSSSIYWKNRSLGQIYAEPFSQFMFRIWLLLADFHMICGVFLVRLNIVYVIHESSYCELKNIKQAEIQLKEEGKLWLVKLAGRYTAFTGLCIVYEGYSTECILQKTTKKQGKYTSSTHEANKILEASLESNSITFTIAITIVSVFNSTMPISIIRIHATSWWYCLCLPCKEGKKSVQKKVNISLANELKSTK